MKKRSIIIILILVIILAIIFMVKGAKDTGRKYSVEEVKNHNYFVLQKDDKYGVINKESNIIVEPKFENVIVPNPSKEVFICYIDNNTTKVYNEKNEEILANYKDVSSIRLKNLATDLMYEKSVLRYRDGQKYGLIDYSGNKITEAIYESIESLGYKEGELLVKQDGKYGVINIKGTILVPIKYETVTADGYYNENSKYENSGYIVSVKTEEGYRYGYLDVDENVLLETQYNEISRITDTSDDKNIYLIASKNGQYGVYKNKNKLINHEYQSIQYNKNVNLFILEKSKKFGVADIDGNVKIEVKYSQININGQYLYAKNKEGKIEVYNEKCEMTNVSENIYKYKVADNKYTITIETGNDKTLYGIEDAQGKTVVNPTYIYIEYLHDNYFIACNQDGKLGVITDKGEEKISIKYSSIQRVKETEMIQTMTSDDGITQIYSKDMEKICEMKDAIVGEEENYIEVYNENEEIYISHEGKRVSNKQVYENNDLISVQKDGKWGFEDKSGIVKIECIYDKVTEFNQYGYAGIRKDNKWGVINKEGKVILEPKYEFKTKERPSFLGEYYKVSYGFGEEYYSNKQ